MNRALLYIVDNKFVQDFKIAREEKKRIKSNRQRAAMNKTSISSSDLIDAKLEDHQLCGSKHCPGCGHKLEGKPDWLGLPAGVKFDPTDQELMEHLEAKVEDKLDIKSHPLIDEFIPTIEGEDGICYTHPEKLPGVTRDGLSRHFFHRPSKAYTTGTRKRRKIQTECDLPGGETRWHKTGKTRPVIVNGKQKGCKKILVLYTNFGKNRKPEKTNWVMHQYHLGTHEEEKEGELVVSKIFYQTQPRQCNWSDRSGATMTVEGSSTDIIIPSNRRESRSASSSSKELNIAHRDQHEVSGTDQVAVAISNYNAAIDIQHLKSDHFGFLPFRKSFDEVGIADSSSGLRDQAPAALPQSSGTCELDQQQQHHVQIDQHQQQHQHQHHHYHHAVPPATVAFHVSRPSHPISTIISPPNLHHSTSINILDHEDHYHVSRLMLQSDQSFQQQPHQQQQQPHHQPGHHEQQHHKMGGRSASGLEELIMSCTSTDIKAESSSITNPQEAEWLKYSDSFWPDPDNQDHHG